MLDNFTLTRRNSAPHTSSFNTPIIWSKFSSYFDKNLATPFLGRLPKDSARAKYDFKFTYHKAANILKEKTDLTPSPSAIQRSQQAAQFFFEKIHAFCQKNHIEFPLKDLNKCIGFLAVPKSRLVLVALSQDRLPENDEQIRKSLIHCLEGINLEDPSQVFELVKTPTKEQYLMVRALSAWTTMIQPPKELIEPRTRCVEVALAVACNKLGRTRKLCAQDLSIQAFGTGLWGSAKDAQPVKGFQAMVRNQKYLYQEALPVELGNGQKGWIDPWKPCPEHCKKFLPAIRALSLSGGQGSSYLEPRSDHPLPNAWYQKRLIADKEPEPTKQKQKVQ